MIIESLQTTNFAWAKHIENTIDNGNITIYNRNTGLPDSSFNLEDGTYLLVISLKPIDTENPFSEVEGFLNLSGTEKDNLFLESISEPDEPHKRHYFITSNTLVFGFTKEYLIEKELFNQKIYISLNKE